MPITKTIIIVIIVFLLFSVTHLVTAEVAKPENGSLPSIIKINGTPKSIVLQKTRLAPLNKTITPLVSPNETKIPTKNQKIPISTETNVKGVIINNTTVLSDQKTYDVVKSIAQLLSITRQPVNETESDLFISEFESHKIDLLKTQGAQGIDLNSMDKWKNYQNSQLIILYYLNLLDTNILFHKGVKLGLQGAAADKRGDFINTSELYKKSSETIKESEIPLNKIISFIDRIDNSKYPELTIERRETIDRLLQLEKDFSLFADSQSRGAYAFRYISEPGHSQNEAITNARIAIEQLRSLINSPYVGNLAKPILDIYTRKFGV